MSNYIAIRRPEAFNICVILSSNRQVLHIAVSHMQVRSSGTISALLCGALYTLRSSVHTERIACLLELDTTLQLYRLEVAQPYMHSCICTTSRTARPQVPPESAVRTRTRPPRRSCAL